MKRITLIVLFLGLTILIFGQSIEDKEVVIQMSIDLKELQPYFHKDKTEERIPLIILNNGIVSDFLELTKFGEPVQFMAKNDLFFNNREAFLDFDKFEISPTLAAITFHYHIEGLTVMLTFEKQDDLWEIKSKELIEK